MKTIKVNLVNDLASLVTVVKDDTSIVLPAIVEPDLTNAIAAYEATYGGLLEFYFVTESPSLVATITLQHTTVDPESTTKDFPVIISDNMPAADKPASEIITYLEALALL